MILKSKKLVIVLAVAFIITMIMVLWTDYKVIGALLGIPVLFILIIDNVKSPKSKKPVRFEFGKRVVKIWNPMSILWSIGCYIFLLLPRKEFDIIWLYYFLFDFFLLSDFRISLDSKSNPKI